MSKISLFYNISAIFSILLSSTCHAMEKDEMMTKEESSKPPSSSIQTKQTPSRRELKSDGWNQLTADEKSKLIPGPNSSTFSKVSTLLHGSQFKHLGKIENLFRQYCTNLTEGTVVVWGDGYGRVSIDAFRRNAAIRVVYNDLDPKNMVPFQKLKQLCFTPGDQEQLVSIQGNCLTIPTASQFQNLFLNHDPMGQVSATFGANFLHFMTPEEVVNYFSLQFDLLRPGGKTFSIFNNLHVEENGLRFGRDINKLDISNYLAHPIELIEELNMTKTVIVQSAKELLERKDVSFSGFMNGEWVKANKGTTDAEDRRIFSALFAHHPKTNAFNPQTIELVAKAIGFEVEEKTGLTLTSLGFEDRKVNDLNGNYTGFVLKKPSNAPSVSNSDYFRNSKGFKDLLEKAKEEEKFIRTFYEKVTFKPKYPFLSVLE